MTAMQEKISTRDLLIPICDTLRLNIPLEDTDPTPLPSISSILESENPIIPPVPPIPVPNAPVATPDSIPVPPVQPNVNSIPTRTTFYDEVPQDSNVQDPQAKLIQRFYEHSS
jgi:hypothetical protein